MSAIPLLCLLASILNLLKWKWVCAFFSIALKRLCFMWLESVALIPPQNPVSCLCGLTLADAFSLALLFWLFLACFRNRRRSIC